MKSAEEIKAAHDLITDLLHGDMPIVFSKKAESMLEDYLQVLCWVMGCDGAVMNLMGLKEAVEKAQSLNNLSEIKSWSLAE